MGSSSLKKICILSNICVLLFSVLYATQVIKSFANEEIESNKLVNNELALVNEVEKQECDRNFIMNLGFAIILAALWNVKKVIKVGVI